MAKRKRILVAPLNWGLGHATRCIPIIKKLKERGYEVIVAASDRPYHLLKKEFPELTHIYFPNYEIDYPEKGKMGWHMFKMAPEVFRQTGKEHRKLKKIIGRHKIKGVISDNRFGLSSKQVPCIFISHQLQLEMPKGWGVFKRLVNWINLSYMKKFEAIWIPDFEGEHNLSGSLSHFNHIPKNTTYLGLLSRFSELKEKEVKETGSYDLLISISGPEPQRTILENRLTEQALKLPYKTLMVVGKTEDGKESVDITENFKKVAHLNAERMYSAMRDAKYIICRSGYSTVMDLAAIAQKAAFIPTPGQSEQEYLAEKYKNEGLANFMAQDVVNIEQLIAEYENYTGFGGFDAGPATLDKCLDVFLQRVETHTPYKYSKNSGL